MSVPLPLAAPMLLLDDRAHHVEGTLEPDRQLDFCRNCRADARDHGAHCGMVRLVRDVVVAHEVNGQFLDHLAEISEHHPISAYDAYLFQEAEVVVIIVLENV